MAVDANPTSGYDDAVHVVMEKKHSGPEPRLWNPVVAYRSRETAEEVAEKRDGEMTSTCVQCIGLQHE